MKKLLAVTLIVFFSSVFSFSQIEKPKTPDWQAFAPDGEDFSVETPVPLNNSFVLEPASKNSGQRYVNSLDGTYFYIFSDLPKNAFQLRFVLKFAYSNQESAVSQDINGLEAKKFEFADNEDFYHTIIVVNGKTRYYVFQTISPTKENAVAERFLRSIKFAADSPVGNSDEIKKQTETVIDLSNSNSSTTKAENGNISTSGVAIDSVVKTNPEINTQTPSPTTKITAGVRILSKPKALYTDSARFYEMAGKVTVRVVLSANGLIGTITPVSKLPFGLTNQAIIAARGIKFAPAMRDGVAYSVVKTVEYSFTIY